VTWYIVEEISINVISIKRENLQEPGVNFINVLGAAFVLIDPKSVKNTVKSSVSVYAFGLRAHKSCM